MPLDREIWSWQSPALGREMQVARWGYYGKPVLLFPTAGGDFLECERFLMVRALSPLIRAGRIKLYACGSVANEGWMSQDAPPAYKSRLQARFDRYVVDELLPHIHSDCDHTEQRLAAAGASLGAYNAVNAAAKHPEWFDRVVAMSGTYLFDRWMDGHWDEDYYFNMPIQYVPGMKEGPQLALLRRCVFVIATGQGRWEAPAESQQLAAALESKGVPCHLELWGNDCDHDWPTWRTMLPMFLDRII